MNKRIGVKIPYLFIEEIKEREAKRAFAAEKDVDTLKESLDNFVEEHELDIQASKFQELLNIALDYPDEISELRVLGQEELLKLSYPVPRDRDIAEEVLDFMPPEAKSDFFGMKLHIQVQERNIRSYAMNALGTTAVILTNKSKGVI